MITIIVLSRALIDVYNQINVVFRHLRESKLAEEDHTVSPMLVLRKSGQLLSNLRFVVSEAAVFVDEHWGGN